MTKKSLLFFTITLSALSLCKAQNYRFRDENGFYAGKATGDSYGGFQFYDSNGFSSGTARPNYSGGWDFYDRNGFRVGSEDGN